MIVKDFFAIVKDDPTMAVSHISLYFALINEWELQKYPDELIIERDNVMKSAKIGGRATYNKCLHVLHNAGYIKYLPAVGCAKSRLRFRKLG